MPTRPEAARPRLSGRSNVRFPAKRTATAGAGRTRRPTLAQAASEQIDELMREDAHVTRKAIVPGKRYGDRGGRRPVIGQNLHENTVQQYRLLVRTTAQPFVRGAHRVTSTG